MTFLKTLALAAPFTLSLTFSAAADDCVHVNNAFALTSAASAAVYLEVKSHQDEDDILLSAATDAARKTTIHRSAESVDGVMSMAQTTLPMPALGFLTLRPGQDHIMLMGLTRKLTEGDMIFLTLTFERAGAVTIEVPVVKAAPAAAAHSDHPTTP